MLRARQTLAVRRTLSCTGQRVGRAQLTAAMAECEQREHSQKVRNWPKPLEILSRVAGIPGFAQHCISSEKFPRCHPKLRGHQIGHHGTQETRPHDGHQRQRLLVLLAAHRRRAQAHPSRGRVLLPSPTSTASRRCGDRLSAADERRVRPKRRGSKEAQASSGVCRGAQVQARSVAPTSRLWLLLKRIATARRGELKR